MENQTKQFTAEELNESRIYAKELLAELKPFLEEYFIGEVVQDGRCITYTLPNGQTFKISAGEVIA